MEPERQGEDLLKEFTHRVATYTVYRWFTHLSFAGVAQLVEQEFCKFQAAGSCPVTSFPDNSSRVLYRNKLYIFT